MKTMQVRLPDHVHERLKQLAREEGVSLNSLIVTSVSNEVVRQETRDSFRSAAASYDPKAFAEALAAVANAPASPGASDCGVGIAADAELPRGTRPSEAAGARPKNPKQKVLTARGAVAYTAE